MFIWLIFGFLQSFDALKDWWSITETAEITRPEVTLVISVYLSHFAGSVWARRLDDGVVRHRVLITQLPDRH